MQLHLIRTVSIDEYKMRNYLRKKRTKKLFYTKLNFERKKILTFLSISSISSVDYQLKLKTPDSQRMTIRRLLRNALLISISISRFRLFTFSLLRLTFTPEELLLFNFSPFLKIIISQLFKLYIIQHFAFLSSILYSTLEKVSFPVFKIIPIHSNSL